MELHLNKCPICGGELVIKETTKVVRGGGHTAILKVKAPVCLYCGERLYSLEQVKWFDEVRAKLRTNDTNDFERTGTSFKIVS